MKEEETADPEFSRCISSVREVVQRAGELYEQVLDLPDGPLDCFGLLYLCMLNLRAHGVTHEQVLTAASSLLNNIAIHPDVQEADAKQVRSYQ